jgi:hypothetical protein
MQHLHFVSLAEEDDVSLQYIRQGRQSRHRPLPRLELATYSHVHKKLRSQREKYQTVSIITKLMTRLDPHVRQLVIMYI